MKKKGGEREIEGERDGEVKVGWRIEETKST